MKKLLFLFLSAIILFSCSQNNTPDSPATDNRMKEITIFSVNDVHAQINNFAKLKYIIDQERENSEVFVVSVGDLFSGNPVVDNHPDKGYPIIDLMNQIGFDISCIGNHEFDYGLENLNARIKQAKFPFICANIDTKNSPLQAVPDFISLTKGDVKISFLGLVETNGKENVTIPSTHPWRVKEIGFQRPEDVVALYSDIKQTEKSDLYICLSHLGYNGNEKVLGDVQLANQFPYFDLILGGHSHSKINTKINSIPIIQCGSYLNYVGKLKLTIQNQKIVNFEFERINLNHVKQYDAEMSDKIDLYNNQDYLTDIIGYSHRNHGGSEVGCFYTDALRTELNVDVSFQNTGGIRSGLDEGDITKREIYEISPFNNGTIIYQMSVFDIKKFLIGSGSGFYYSGIQISQSDQDVIIRDLDGNILPDDTILSVGLNDYIPAVHDIYFPENGEVQTQTDAETIISYLENTNDQVDYASCDHYFRMK